MYHSEHYCEDKNCPCHSDAEWHKRTTVTLKYSDEEVKAALQFFLEEKPNKKENKTK